MSPPRRSGARRTLRRLRVLLLPEPITALALALLAAVVGAALVSGPLLLGSVAEDTWDSERARHPAHDLGVTVDSSTLPRLGEADPARIMRATELDDAVRSTAAGSGLGTVDSRLRLGDSVVVQVPGGTGLIGMQLLHRTGWEDHVRLVEGAVTDDGVVIPSGLAERAGVSPGDRLTTVSGADGPTSIEVSGVYAELTGAVPAYWEPVSELFRPVPHPLSGNPREASPVALARQDVVVSVAAAASEDLRLQWLFPLPPGIDVDGARAAQRRFEDLQVRLVDPTSAAGELGSSGAFDRPTAVSGLPGVLDGVDRTTVLLRPSVRVVSLGAAAAGLVLVGAWAAQTVRRRSAELESLVTRGMSPAGGALQAAREAVVPLTAGSLAGGLAGWLLVRTAGPSPRLPAGAPAEALVAPAIGSGAALLVVVLVTAALVARLDRLGRGTLARSLGRVPWLGITAAAAVVTAVPVLRQEAGQGRIDVLTLGLPLLLTLVAAGTVTAALPWLGRVTAARSARLSPGPFLAVRRIVSARGAARLVVITTALSTGLVVYAGALGDSAGRTVSAKTAVAAGGSTVVPLVRRADEPGPLPAGTALVGTEQGATLAPGEVTADLLAVDPEEIRDVIGWDDALADEPLEVLLARLDDEDTDRVPALIAGPVPDDDAYAPGTELTLTFFSYYSLPVEVVGRSTAFPGQTSRVPLLVVAWDRVGPALEDAERDPAAVFEQQVWGTGPPEPLLGALTDSGYAYDADGVVTAGAFAARPEIRAQDWSLAYLRSIALAAGVLGLLGVAFHALAQQRRRTVAALLLSRMGMSRGAANRSAALEIGLLAVLGAVVAVATALPASALVVRLFDPDPALLPAPLFTVPWSSIAAVLAGAVVVTVAGGLLVARAARRAPAGEVLRDAG
jgi:hypothetical protein